MNDLTHVILGDLHARWDKTREVLETVGVITVNSADPMTDVRNPGFWVIQLGDAVSLGYDETEAPFLRWFYDVVQPDETLLGNHEAPAVWFDPWRLDFTGYWSKEEMDAKWDPSTVGHYPYEVGRDHEATAMVQKRFAEGKFTVATHVGKWLITHAGVAIRYQKEHHYRDVPAELIASDLNGRFDRCMNLKTIDNVISHTGEMWGGILWQRFEYLRNGYRDIHVPQIVGHSGYSGSGQHLSNLWCIDTVPPSKRERKKLLLETGAPLTRGEMGGVCALVSKDNGETFEMTVIP